jgi:dihydroorotate dehydrogenase (NAD+) catalytic subunit
VKPKKRVVTSGKGPGGPASKPAGRSKRTPTVRTIRSAIVEPKAGPAKAGPAKGPAAAGGAGRAATSAPAASPVVALGSPTIAPVAPGGRGGSRGAGEPSATVDLSVDLGRGLVLANPVLVASGTFGYGVEYADVVEVERLGAICCKGTTLKARAGNRPPRVTETPGGMLNSIGLQNPGVDAVLDRYAPLWATWKVPVIVNVAGESIEDYVGVVRKLDLVPGVAGVELNISCPNVGKGGLQFAIDQDAAAAVTRAVRRATDLPLIVKLSPNVADVRPIARAIADAGADALSAVNTLSGMALRADRSGPFLGNTYGGLSGPAIKPVALRIVYEVAQVVDIPVIAIGGITGLDDVLDYLAAGAVAVQVGTAIFADPTLPVRLIDALSGECARRGLASYEPLVGTALPRRPGPASAKGAEYRP